MAFEHTLGLKLTRRQAGGVTCRLALHEGHLNGDGVVHGGVLASVADEAAWYAIVEVHGRNCKVTTTNLTIHYLRPATGTFLRARCFVLKPGRRLFSTRVEIFDARGKLAAHASVTYMILEAPATA
ncbi:MAG: PaaI family thioesterase [Acidobacteria bacterium]|nr:PaaI family thioesterase [Acidobacteriota bacterium]